MAQDHFTCQECAADFDSREKLERHNKQQHGGGMQSGSPDSIKTRETSGSDDVRESSRREWLE